MTELSQDSHEQYAADKGQPMWVKRKNSLVLFGMCKTNAKCSCLHLSTNKNNIAYALKRCVSVAEFAFIIVMNYLTLSLNMFYVKLAIVTNLLCERLDDPDKDLKKLYLVALIYQTKKYLFSKTIK